jgi:hypothetical protein
MSDGEDCCAHPSSDPPPGQITTCPSNGRVGRSVPLITLKALLRPPALASLVATAAYRYCSDPACDTVYYAPGKEYVRADLEVPVSAKETGEDIPICYCFGWDTAEPARHGLLRGRLNSGPYPGAPLWVRSEQPKRRMLPRGRPGRAGRHRSPKLTTYGHGSLSDMLGSLARPRVRTRRRSQQLSA